MSKVSSGVLTNLMKAISHDSKSEIEIYQKLIIDSIESFVDDPKFYLIPFEIFSEIVSQVDFSQEPDNDKLVTILKSLITNASKRYESKAISLLNLIDCKNSTLKLQDYQQIIGSFSTSDICTQISKLASFEDQLPQKDYTFLLKQKDDEINLMKKQVSKLLIPDHITFPPVSNQPPPDFEPDILKAVKFNKLSSVQYLVEKKHEDVKQILDYDFTLLHYAALYGNIEIMQYLINKGADINAMAVYNDGTPVFSAASTNLRTVVYCIEKLGVDIYKKNAIGNTIIHIAALHRKFDIVKYLIEEKKMDVDVRGNISRTPLHQAFREKAYYIFQYLIEQKNADPEKQDDNRWTSLHIAVDSGHYYSVEYLLSSCHVKVNPKDKDGLTPLHIAAKHDFSEIAELLLNYGADKSIKANNNQRPYDLAVSLDMKSLLE